MIAATCPASAMPCAPPTGCCAGSVVPAAWAGRRPSCGASSARYRVKAAIWHGPGEMTVGDVPEPDCPADGILLEVTACGICGTDVRTFFNGDRRIEPGAVLGHEICGRVLEVGGAVDGDVEADVGDLVHVISTLYCGRCRLCRDGNEHLCQRGGLMGFDYQGAYAERVAIPEVALKNVFRIPAGLDDIHATFADPL